MNPRLRRLLIIAAFVLIVLMFGYLIYLVFFRPTPTVTNRNGNGNINGLPITQNGNLVPRNTNGLVNALPSTNTNTGATKPSDTANGGPTLAGTLVNTPTDGLTIVGDTNLLEFYDKNTGHFYQMSPDGSTKSLLTNDIYKSVQSVSWSPDGHTAVLTFPDNSKILYDFNAKKQTTLPKELNAFSFSPRSDSMVSKYLDGSNTDNQWLVITKPDGSQSQTVEHIGTNAAKVVPLWSPNNTIVATYEQSADADHTDILFLGANGEDLPSVTVNGRGFDPKWSPDGRRVLYSTYSADTEDNPHLYMMNASPDTLGSGMVDLGLDTTADKCAFSGNGYTLYCAVPYYMNPGSGPQPELSSGIPDNIYKVDLLTGVSTVIARPVDESLNQRFSAANLSLSPREDALFFTDATNGTIQRLLLR